MYSSENFQLPFALEISELGLRLCTDSDSEPSFQVKFLLTLGEQN